MKKELSLVCVDTRNHRVIAQENWGLTAEQMKGMHVHHRILRSQGGTNDPTNLFVCTPWFHANIWHDEVFWIETQRKAATSGAKTTHSKKDSFGRSVHALKMRESGMGKLSDEETRDHMKMVRSNFIREKDEFGRDINALNSFGSNKKSIKVTNITTGETFVFDSARLAQKQLGVGHLNEVANGTRKTSKGFIAEWEEG
jgi:hypothetical protein